MHGVYLRIPRARLVPVIDQAYRNLRDHADEGSLDFPAMRTLGEGTPKADKLPLDDGGLGQRLLMRSEDKGEQLPPIIVSMHTFS